MQTTWQTEAEVKTCYVTLYICVPPTAVDPHLKYYGYTFKLVRKKSIKKNRESSRDSLISLTLTSQLTAPKLACSHAVKLIGISVNQFQALSWWFGYPLALGIPSQNTLVFWVSLVIYIKSNRNSISLLCIISLH